MFRVVVPDNKEKIKKQIQALEKQIKKDTNEKDKHIHIQALKDLKIAYIKK